MGSVMADNAECLGLLCGVETKGVGGRGQSPLQKENSMWRGREGNACVDCGGRNSWEDGAPRKRGQRGSVALVQVARPCLFVVWRRLLVSFSWGVL